jgi:hypothetical protein
MRPRALTFIVYLSSSASTLSPRPRGLALCARFRPSRRGIAASSRAECFLAIVAMLEQWALRTLGIPSGTDLPAVPNELVGKSGPPRPRDELHEIKLDLHRVLMTSEPKTLGNAAHVSVNNNTGSVEGGSKNDVGGLSSDSGKGDQLVKRPRHLAAKTINEGSAATPETLRLVPEEARGPNVILQFMEGGAGVVPGRTVLVEKALGYLVHPLIRALGGEDCRHQEFQRIGEIQAALGVWICLFQNTEDGRHVLHRISFLPVHV